MSMIQDPDRAGRGVAFAGAAGMGREGGSCRTSWMRVSLT